MMRFRYDSKSYLSNAFRYNRRRTVEPSSASSPHQDPGGFYTMNEVARLKGVSYHTVSRAVRQGKPPATRMGRMALIDANDLPTWTPMRERAPHKYTRREPDPTTTPAVIDLASGERLEFARRLSSLYEVIHSSAMQQSLGDFAQVLAETFARAMEFSRVAIWIVSQDRTTIRRTASVGEWYSPGKAAVPDEVPWVEEWDAITPEPTLFDRPKIAGLPNLKNLDKVSKLFTTPLRVGDKLIGFITADRGGAPLAFTESWRQIAQGFATQAALAIDLNMTRQAEAEQRAQLETTVARTRAIAEVSLTLNAGVDLRTVLRNASHQITQLLGAERGGIGLQIEEHKLLGLWTFSGQAQPDEWMPVNLGIYPGTVRALERGKSTLAHYSEMSIEEQRILDEGGIRSNIITPLIIDGDLTGAMYVLYTEEYPDVRDEDLEFNDAIAAQCLVAIRQARLSDQLTKEHERLVNALDELQRLSTELTAATDGHDESGQNGIINIQQLISKTVTRIDSGLPLWRTGL